MSEWPKNCDYLWVPPDCPNSFDDVGVVGSPDSPCGAGPICTWIYNNCFHTIKIEVMLFSSALACQTRQNGF